MLATAPELRLVAAAYASGLRPNLSPSIPPGVYRVTKGLIERGAIVVVCLPSALAAFARSRDYISGASCEDGNAPVDKVIAAMAGDTVDFSPVSVTVNGHYLPNTRPLASDQRGRGLPHPAYGRYRVPTGQIWLVSTYSPRSFDSRYFGVVPTARIVPRAADYRAALTGLNEHGVEWAEPNARIISLTQ